MPRKPTKKINGVFKRIIRSFIKVSGAWKTATVWQNVEGTWKRITPIPYFPGIGFSFPVGYFFAKEFEFEVELWFKATTVVPKFLQTIPGTRLAVYFNSSSDGIITLKNEDTGVTANSESIITETDRMYKVKYTLATDGAFNLFILNNDTDVWENKLSANIGFGTGEATRLQSLFTERTAKTYYIRVKGKCDGVLKEGVYDLAKDIGTKVLTDRYNNGINGAYSGLAEDIGVLEE